MTLGWLDSASKTFLNLVNEIELGRRTRSPVSVDHVQTPTGVGKTLRELCSVGAVQLIGQ